MDAHQYNFQKLTPTDDVDLGIYEDAIEYVFRNDDVRNIAISGAYGAGKSSVLETYKRLHPERKFLHVSLAHFAEDTADEKGSAAGGTEAGAGDAPKGAGEVKSGADGAGSRTDGAQGAASDADTASLEGKIINQLVHQIAPERIPQTNFVMKRQVKEKEVRACSARIFLLLLLGAFLCFHGAWCSLVEGLSWEPLRKLLAFTTTREAVLCCALACAALLGRVCYLLVKRQMNRNFLKKVNVKSNNLDIELFNRETDSYFDKYLNEVLYLLENADVDGIVFEDMDRYDRNRIFEKLLEINTLLNRRLEKFAGGRPLRFFYLLKDDMFRSKDRTKFFDFIIPVVPVVDGSNSLDKFLEYFAQSGLEGLFEPDFLRGLSLYVDDMRILKNICNEFLIYYEKLQKSATELNNNKLLAVITYKNIFPRDYARLQVSEGYVFQLFERKSKLIEEKLEAVQASIDEAEEEERAAAREIARSRDELDAIYFMENRPIRVDGKNGEQFASRAELVAAIRKNNYEVSLGKPSSSYYSTSYEWNSADLRQKFRELEANPEYAERSAALKKREQKNRREADVRLSGLRREMEELSGAYLKDLITKDNEKEIFDAPVQHTVGGTDTFEDVKKSPYFPLIRFLLRDGYLDETYPDYMTFFYERSISRQDKVFLRSITDRRAKPFDYPLKDVKLVIAGIRRMDFETEECRNYQLLDALLEDSAACREPLRMFLRGLWNEEPQEFVDGYLCRGRNIRRFADAFNRSWESACYWVLSSEFSETARRTYVLGTLYSADAQSLSVYNREGVITEYLNGDADFLQIEKPDGAAAAWNMEGPDGTPYPDKAGEEKLIEAFRTLKVRFRDIHAGTAHPALLQRVYEENLYELSKPMIDFFLEHFYHIAPSDEYRTSPLTLILSQEQPLAKYVKGHLGEYLRLQIAEGEELCESEDAVLYVLNGAGSDGAGLDGQCRLDYLKLVKTRLTGLADVNDKALWSVLLPGNVADSRENLCDYFYQSGNGMDEALAAYINQYQGPLALDAKDLDGRYGESAGNRLFWAIVKCDALDNGKYMELLQSFRLTISSLGSEHIEGEKLRLLIQGRILRMTSENLSYLRKHDPSLAGELIRHNTEGYLALLAKEEVDAVPEETVQLYSRYPQEKPEVQEKIRRVALQNLDHILAEQIGIPPELTEALLSEREISVEDRQHLLANAAPQPGRAKMRKLMRLLELEPFEKLLSGDQVSIDATEANRALLETFRRNGWISDYEEDEKKGVYTACGRKAKSARAR